jgi:hypothetical protein
MRHGRHRVTGRKRLGQDTLVGELAFRGLPSGAEGDMLQQVRMSGRNSRAGYGELRQDLERMLGNL